MNFAPKAPSGTAPQAGEKIERFEAVGNTSVASVELGAPVPARQLGELGLRRTGSWALTHDRHDYGGFAFRTAASAATRWHPKFIKADSTSCSTTSSARPQAEASSIISSGLPELRAAIRIASPAPPPTTS